MVAPFSLLLISLAAQAAVSGTGPGTEGPALVSCIDTADPPSAMVMDRTTAQVRGTDGRVWTVTVKPSCPDLAFHDYATFVPVGAQLCTGRDSLISREGYSCEIVAIKSADRETSGAESNPASENGAGKKGAGT